MERKLKLAIPENFSEIGQKLNNYINEIKNSNENYLADMKLVRFNNGDGKCILNESVRDYDVYILTDVGNYDICYDAQRGKHYMMPDEHYQDIKRIISAMDGHPEKITLVMPFLYQSRQDKRSLRESLDCAMALQELERYNISEIVTIDAHNPIVANAIPTKMTFSNGYATGELILSILNNENINLENIFVVGPDEGSRVKAKFLADILGGVRFGNFDKRRDYTKIVDGKSPIVQHEFVGPENLSNTDIIIVDDMIATGGSLISTARELKRRGANRIYIMTTYALFTKGVKEFNEAYEEGLFNKVYSTNLSYVPKEYRDLEWFQSVDCTYKLAQIICNLNEGKSIRDLLNDKEETANKVKELIK